jgi:hypothetical protein
MNPFIHFIPFIYSIHSIHSFNTIYQSIHSINSINRSTNWSIHPIIFPSNPIIHPSIQSSIYPSNHWSTPCWISFNNSVSESILPLNLYHTCYMNFILF